MGEKKRLEDRAPWQSSAQRLMDTDVRRSDPRWHTAHTGQEPALSTRSGHLLSQPGGVETPVWKGLMYYQGHRDKPLMKTVIGPLMRRRAGHSKGLSGRQKWWALCSREAHSLQPPALIDGGLELLLEAGGSDLSGNEPATHPAPSQSWLLDQVRVWGKG